MGINREHRRVTLLAGVLAVTGVIGIVVGTWGRGEDCPAYAIAGLAFSGHSLPNLELELLASRATVKRSTVRDPFEFVVPDATAPQTTRAALPAVNQAGEVESEPRPRTVAKGPDEAPVNSEYLGCFGPGGREVSVWRQGSDIVIVQRGDTIGDRYVVEAFDAAEARLRRADGSAEPELVPISPR